VHHTVASRNRVFVHDIAVGMRSVDNVTRFGFYGNWNNGSVYVDDIQRNRKTFVLCNHLISSDLINEFSSGVNKHAINEITDISVIKIITQERNNALINTNLILRSVIYFPNIQY
jgi:hypothetical protein